VRRDWWWYLRELVEDIKEVLISFLFFLENIEMRDEAKRGEENKELTVGRVGV
jgi:hypothetical protein